MAGRLEFGDLVLQRYGNWHRDPNPLIFVLYSDALYTHGLNSHYISKTEAEQLRKLMCYIPPGQQHLAYDFLKARFNSVLRSYRVYKTPLIYIIKKWRAIELKDSKTQDIVNKFFDSSKSYQKVLQSHYQTPASKKAAGISSTEQALLSSLRNALVKLSAKAAKK